MELRPLAHVSLRDQVVTTAIMLCLADLVETLQGDPRPNGYALGEGVRKRYASAKRWVLCSRGKAVFSLCRPAHERPLSEDRNSHTND